MERGSYNQHSQQLITTKLTIPPSYLKKIIPRTRIYTQLDTVQQRPLMLISAAAGMGKTTLVSTWLRQQHHSTPAWFSLEQADNDIVRFWRYFITALSQQYPGLIPLDHDWQELLQSATIETTLTGLINTLMTLEQSTILVLDNYQVIRNPNIHSTLTFLLEHLPPQLHIILITRVDPPLPLARFRVQGKLAELHTDDLRFTDNEAHLFLTQTMNLDLRETEITELVARTEGWIAGLQLATLYLQSQSSRLAISHFIDTFSGTNKHVMDYLVNEVLIYQPEEIQQFLLKTSILERLRASLCDTITGQTNSEEMIERLQQNNLFLVPLDNQQQWYRYDRLFAELLHARLKQKMPGLQSELHQRASLWYEQHNMIVPAISHALAADDLTRVTTLIENNASMLIQNDKDMAIQEWLERLPMKIIVERAMLSFLYATMLLAQGRIEDSERALARVQEYWQRENDSLMLGRCYLLRSDIALLRGNGPQAVNAAFQSLGLFNEEQTSLQNRALLNIGAGYMTQGDIEQAGQYIVENYHLNQHYLDQKTILLAATHLGTLQTLQGNLRAAAQTFQQILVEADSSKTWFRITAHTHLANIYSEWNNLTQALEHSQQALQLIQQTRLEDLASAHTYLVAARLAWLNEHYDQVTTLLDQAEQYAQKFGPNRPLLAHITALRTRNYLSTDNLPIAQRWASQYALSIDRELYTDEREVWAQIHARLVMYQEQGNEVIPLLEEVYEQARAQKRVQSQITLLVQLTLAYHTQGNTQYTRHSLEQALILAEPGGYIRTFTNEGNVMATLLTEIYTKHQRHVPALTDSQTLSPGYIYTLLNSFAAAAETQPSLWMIAQDNTDLLIDKLSEREYMVLGLIAEGLSNQEIAQKLVVTVSTIKTHLNNIYAKLHVHTRLQAVTKAYDLGVLRRSEIDTEPLSHPKPTERI